jgi:hypothetical protein
MLKDELCRLKFAFYFICHLRKWVDEDKRHSQWSTLISSQRSNDVLSSDQSDNEGVMAFFSSFYLKSCCGRGRLYWDGWIKHAFASTYFITSTQSKGRGRNSCQYQLALAE